MIPSPISLAIGPSPPLIPPNSPTLRPPVTAASRPYAAGSISQVTVASGSLYDVLGISICPAKDDIKDSYRWLARIFHPDAAGGRRSAEAAEEFIRIRSAYSTLSDPEKRAAYDRNLCRRFRTAGIFAGDSDSPGSMTWYRCPRRNWETDQCW